MLTRWMNICKSGWCTCLKNIVQSVGCRGLLCWCSLLWCCKDFGRYGVTVDCRWNYMNGRVKVKDMTPVFDVRHICTYLLLTRVYVQERYFWLVRGPHHPHQYLTTTPSLHPLLLQQMLYHWHWAAALWWIYSSQTAISIDPNHNLLTTPLATPPCLKTAAG